MVYPALLPLMRTPWLPVVDWTDAPADLNGLVRFAERRNLVSARAPSHLNWPLPRSLVCYYKHFEGVCCLHLQVSLQKVAEYSPETTYEFWSCHNPVNWKLNWCNESALLQQYSYVCSAGICTAVVLPGNSSASLKFRIHQFCHYNNREEVWNSIQFVWSHCIFIWDWECYYCHLCQLPWQ